MSVERINTRRWSDAAKKLFRDDEAGSLIVCEMVKVAEREMTRGMRRRRILELKIDVMFCMEELEGRKGQKPKIRCLTGMMAKLETTFYRPRNECS